MGGENSLNHGKYLTSDAGKSFNRQGKKLPPGGGVMMMCERGDAADGMAVLRRRRLIFFNNEGVGRLTMTVLLQTRAGCCYEVFRSNHQARVLRG